MRPLFEIVKDCYNTPGQVRKFAERAENGFLKWESAVVAEYFRPPASVLDVGCGAGREAFALSDLGCQVTAVDVSEEQLQRAKANSERLAKPIKFGLSDGTNLDFPDASFDHVIVWSQVLGNVPGKDNRSALVSECSRVLRPGGAFSCSVHNRDVCKAAAKPLMVDVSGVDFELEDGDFLLKEGEATPCYWHYFTAPELVDLCSRTGL